MRAICFALTMLLIPSLSGANTSALTGTWISASIQPTGDATLTITRKVRDARGKTVPTSTSIEHASLVIGDVKNSNDVRSELETTVKHAERQYPDPPEATWPIEGLHVEVATFNGTPGEIEVRVDFPDGRGSFWERLRRTSGKRQ